MITSGNIAVLMILSLNTIIAIVIFILAFYQEKELRSSWIMLSWFIMIVPFIGVLYILICKLISFIRRKDNIDLTALSFSHEREKSVFAPEQETEMNFVPIQDAMAVSGVANLRKLLLDALRDNAKKTISSITAVLKSEDTEASHYAATMITDSLSEFRSTAQNMILQMNRVPEDVEINLLALEYIYEILSLKIMTEVEQESYIYTLNTIAENLYTNNLWYMTATHYLWMTDMFLLIKDYNMAELWASRSSRYRPDYLDTYKANLHLNYAKRDQEAFFQCLKDLRQTNITVDEEVLNLFRLYGDEYQKENSNDRK